jgi:GNAT superfamily N-acetyltransferase
MSSYRFCRTDDIGLLVDALNRCWAPYFPDEPPMTPAAFKRSIRDLQVWCSSCMVAFAGSDPVGVLIGAKRPGATLVHRIAVHPDHVRQGHGRHMLTSIGSKLAILGPPRIVAEVPETLDAAHGLFTACGYVEEAALTDYVADVNAWAPSAGEAPSPAGRSQAPASFVVPINVDDLSANGLLEAHPQACWQRSIETMTARKHELSGLAVASDDRIEACVLCAKDGEIVLLRSFMEDGASRLRQLLAQLTAADTYSLRIPKVHPEETSNLPLEHLGFRPAGTGRRYAATARP